MKTNDDILSEFGKKIRSIRESMGLSQEKFSLMIDMDRTYYASVENGKRNISLKNIIKISKGFNISLKDIFDF